jgi:hypothetical protein
MLCQTILKILSLTGVSPAISLAAQNVNSEHLNGPQRRRGDRYQLRHTPIFCLDNCQSMRQIGR